MTTILHGDSAVRLSEFAPDSVHLVVTSPPYGYLRSGGTTGQEAEKLGRDSVLIEINPAYLPFSHAQ